jgi:putative transposase
MPRRARCLQQGDYYHVLNRGSLRARLFHHANDYAAFISLLDQTVNQFELPLFSYCLMPNHWHLVVKPITLSQLSRSMHWLTCTHAVRWCHAHVRRGPGPLYQGRFKSIPVEDGPAIERVCCYVEGNAHTGRLAARADHWPWSSANQRVENRDTPPLRTLPFLVDPSWSDRLAAASEDRAITEAIRKNRPFGSDEWIRKRLSELGMSETGRRGRPRTQKIDPSLL